MFDLTPARWQAHRGIAYLDSNPAGRPAVLLLPGLGANADSWGYQTPALAEAGYRPLAVDTPGFGRSLPPARVWSHRTVTARLAEFMNEIAGGPAHVVGLSLGGTLAQRLAFEYPEKVTRLVLANTFAHLRPRRAGEWRYLLLRAVRAGLLGHAGQADLVAERIFPRPEQAELRARLTATIRAADPRAYRAAMWALAGFDSRRWLTRITAPTLVISGAEDSTVGPALQAALASGIPGARQVIIPAAGHAVTVDQPELFNRALLAFLSAS